MNEIVLKKVVLKKVFGDFSSHPHYFVRKELCEERRPNVAVMAFRI
ncbi:hypothetical protein Fokcrypt_00338 [Candidatus Fokinia cryptica]|uniref:Uncharacterized protein n=1 Tax=Candidatus Fokinia crypta TaxID=1920990 RepID=A0ABZ0UQ39_9RICK|nr:hypothetical protein Fokcrypt_00338 [Candidatus Fokinia cryptica]